MAAINHNASVKLADRTLDRIEKAVEAKADDGLRPHLGASQIGKECERALWYGFRWSSASKFEGRLLRLFDRGHREEDSLSQLLRDAGVTVNQVDPRTGKQHSFSSGHFGGSMDGACYGIAESTQWHVLEFKTAGKKAFDKLEKEGVRKAKPEHFAQMQVYMAWSGMERALYMAVCKDDDRLHLERVDFEKAESEKLFKKADRIIASDRPLDRMSEDPSWYQCKFCDYHSICHGDDVPLPTCRSCAHITVEADGWSCARHNFHMDMKNKEHIAGMKHGCDAHRYIPQLLANFAEPIDADEADNWIKYAMKDGSGEFVNGQPPDGFSSAEIHGSRGKALLVDSNTLLIRETFEGRIVA